MVLSGFRSFHVLVTTKSANRGRSSKPNLPSFSVCNEALRVSPWVHQADVLHAISPISRKLGQFKGSTPKLKMTNWFVVWIFMVGDSPPN